MDFCSRGWTCRRSDGEECAPPRRRDTRDESGLHVDQRTERLVHRGQHFGRRLDRKALLKGVDESAYHSIDAAGRSAGIGNDPRILVDSRQTATDTELRALSGARNAAADREAAHEVIQ